MLQKRSDSQVYDPEYEDLMKIPIVSQYKKFKKDQPVHQKIEENEILNENSDSSQSNLTDASYDSKIYTLEAEETSEYVSASVAVQEQKTGFAGVGSAFLDEILKPKRETEVEDLLQIVNISEYAYQGYAQRKLQDSKAITMQTAKVLTQ